MPNTVRKTIDFHHRTNQRINTSTKRPYPPVLKHKSTSLSLFPFTQVHRDSQRPTAIESWSTALQPLYARCVPWHTSTSNIDTQIHISRAYGLRFPSDNRYARPIPTRREARATSRAEVWKFAPHCPSCQRTKPVPPSFFRLPSMADPFELLPP